MRILDLGAGTGRYSLYLAQKGYEVVAVKLVKRHTDSIEKSRTKSMDFTFINNDMVITTETICYDENFIVNSNYNKDNFKVEEPVYY